MSKNKKIFNSALFGLAILATILLNVAYAQKMKEVELRLISKQSIKESEKRGKVEEINSENGKFKGIVVRGIGLDKHPIDKFMLLDSKENVIWEKKDCGSTVFTITNDGRVIAQTVLGSPFGGPSVFSFFDLKGSLVKCTEELRFRRGTFLHDIGYLLVETRKNDLLVFDTKGNFIQNFGPCKKFIASPEFKNLIVAYDKELRFYRNGKIVGKESVESPPRLEGMVISPDSEYLAYLTRNKLTLFGIAIAKKLWQVDVMENFRYTSVDLSMNAERVVVGLDFDVETLEKHSYGYIYVFDNEGEKLVEQRVEYKKWNIFIPGVDISDDGKFLNVKTYNEIYKYELKSPSR